MRSRLLFIFILSLFLGNCSQPSSPIEQAFDSAVNGRTVSFPRNYNFTLKLDLPADVGYRWEYTISDTSIVRLDSTVYLVNADLTGGVIVETFFFGTLKNGESKISLLERQPWKEGNNAPLKSVAITVRVAD
jgi:predicted secreted protein